MTAYNGGAVILKSTANLSTAAEICAVEGYHAAIVRMSLFAMQVQQLSKDTMAIANTRSALTNNGNPNADDYGIGTLSSPHMILGDANAEATPSAVAQFALNSGLPSI